MEKDDYISWSSRPGYEDIVPTLQDDGPVENAVVMIPYSEKCKIFKDFYFIFYSFKVLDTMNHFRTFLMKKELSTRALTICGETIKLNPSNYTAWKYRRYDFVLL